jgi:NADH:ubiquinone oxidoreductase subunit
MFIFYVLNRQADDYKRHVLLRIQNAFMSSFETFSLIRRLSQVGTLLQTYVYGHEVGRDDFGNRYFRNRTATKGVRERRWVMYKGEPEASKVPAEWHIWLHHTADAPIPDSARMEWQRPHIENMTGTVEAWVPPTVEGKHRPKATGDYQAWQPD